MDSSTVFSRVGASDMDVAPDNSAVMLSVYHRRDGEGESFYRLSRLDVATGEWGTVALPPVTRTVTVP